MKDQHLIGVISDTHGLMRPAAIEALQGVELIVHAGDIGTFAVLDSLRAIAPVVAVRGNNDRGAWAESIPETAEVEIAGRRIYVLHALADLDASRRESGFDVVISGHTHRPSMERRGAVLYLNPGSAGPRRFRLPVCVALLKVEGKSCAARLLELPV